MTLRLEGISSGYGSTIVLRDVSIVVPSGSVVALLGPNGAGKTTLLRTASGVLPALEGRVDLDGVDLTARPPNERLQAGMVHIPEGRGIFRNLTVRENISLFGSSVRETDAIERAVTAFPKLGQRLTQLAGTMSGGEQQMLALSRAHVGNPSVVLLDEVSMGLAPTIVDEIFESIGQLASTGAALLLVEQYVNRALAASDYVYLLDRGRVSFAGEPSELEDEDVFHRYLASSPEPAPS